MNAGADDLRRVAHHFDIVACGQQFFNIAELLIHRIHHGHRVCAALFTDGEHHRGHAIVTGHGFLLLGPVFHPRHVTHADQTAVRLAQDEHADLLHAPCLAQHAEARLAGRILHRAGRDLHVLCAEAALHVRSGQIVGAQPHRIEPHIDLPQSSAQQRDLPHTTHAFKLPPQHLVGKLGDLAHRLVGHEGDVQNRRGIGIELLDDRRVHLLRQIGDDTGDAVPHFL